MHAVCHSCRRLSRSILAVAAGYYTARNFSINTDINTLISPDLDWRKRDNQFDEAFDRDRLILAVVEAPTPELTGARGQGAGGETRRRQQAFRVGDSRSAPASSSRRTGCCSCRPKRSAQLTGQFESAAPLIEIMAGDPSIRGLTGALETGLAGVKRGQVKLDNTARPFNLIAQTVEDVLNKGNATFSWRELISDKPLTDSDRRAFIEFKPILDFRRWSPARMPPTRSARPPPTCNFAERIRRAGPADRPGPDRQ